MSDGELHNFRLINVVGIDGAGKSTLAQNLTSYLENKDCCVQYRYCQYFARLLLPLKLLARFTVMRKTDEFRDYSTYNRTKKNISRQYRLLSSVYAIVWTVDYAFQIFFKINIPLLRGKKLIVDRYVYDTAINLSLTIDNDIGYAIKLISLFHRIVPKPDKVIFIDLPEDIAFARKDDIQGIEYLKERRERYRILAKMYGFVAINGLKNQEKLLEEALSRI